MRVINIVLLVFGIIGVILLILGCVLIPVSRKVLHDKVKQAVVLRDGSEAFDDWVRPPVPVYRRFWVFDVVNPNDIVANGSKPQVKERGPYTYREVSMRVNIHFLDNGTKVSYTQPKSYVFERHLSVGDDNDTFVSVDIPILTLATDVESAAWVVRDLGRVTLSLLNRKLFVTHTVAGYLWGYTDPTLDHLHKLFPSWHIPNGTFGLFYGTNGSDDGVYVVRTGAGDVTKLGQIDSWNGNSSLHYWTTAYSNKINGTDATLFRPFPEKSDRFYVFSSDICRSIYTEFDSESRVRGIDAYRFVPPALVFADVKTNPDNAGFCTPSGDCLHSGVLNISVCKPLFAPVVMSQPHFYQGPIYRDAISGMHPSKQLHETFIDLETHTGVVMNVSKRLQINVHIKQLKAWGETSRFNSTVFPILWLSESAALDEASAGKMRKRVISPLRLARVAEYTMIGVGCALMIAVLVAAVVTRRRATGDEQLIPDEAD